MDLHYERWLHSYASDKKCSKFHATKQPDCRNSILDNAYNQLDSIGRDGNSGPRCPIFKYLNRSNSLKNYRQRNPRTAVRPLAIFVLFAGRKIRGLTGRFPFHKLMASQKLKKQAFRIFGPIVYQGLTVTDRMPGSLFARPSLMPWHSPASKSWITKMRSIR